MIIEFGRWQLRPIDSRNWALATTEQWEAHEDYCARKRKNNKAPSQAAFFQWPNIGYAIHYAATRDLADKEGTATPWEAADEFVRLGEWLLAECCKAMDKYSNPLAKTSVTAFTTQQAGKRSKDNGHD